jgi:putative endopeptidase
LSFIKGICGARRNSSHGGSGVCNTRIAALIKLHGIRNKIGYPDHWRDYSKVVITGGDFAGNVRSTTIFESMRQLNKIGRPVDHGEWQITPPTVDAYYDPQMNDINFPAGVLQPPLYDSRIDDAPNYGDTGGTIGHELTHAFDDEGSQFDAKGNLKNWWTEGDRQKFDARTQCVDDQYSQYITVDDVHLNGKLTLGENVVEGCQQGSETGFDRRAHSRAALLYRLRAMGLRQ